ncbi:hypothetical protein BGZ94_004533 [Podila epigama]|nr:hypothetical protein BGZ94_004533 [Podila epigama]
MEKTEIDLEQKELEVAVSYYASNSMGITIAPASDSFRVLVRFLNENGAYMGLNNDENEGGGGGGFANDLNAGAKSESLLYYSFDSQTMRPVRVPAGARGVVLQILVPDSQTVFCFDYFAMRLVNGAYHPKAQSLLQNVLIGLGAVVIINGGAIPIILFHGLPGWLWRSAPVNFFQKNPVVDHYVPLALFISTCQWIFNIIVNYLGGRASIVHSSQALWLIPLVLIGVFFVSAFAHWALFLCYNQIMQSMARQRYSGNHLFNIHNDSISSNKDTEYSSHRRSSNTRQKNKRSTDGRGRKWRAPILGFWAALCILLTRIGLVMLAIIEGSFWNVPIGILLAVPETIALLSVEYFFIKTIWILARSNRTNKGGINTHGKSSLGIGHDDNNGDTGKPGHIQGAQQGQNKQGRPTDLSRSSSLTPLWPEASSPASAPASSLGILEDPEDDLVNFSSYHHRAYVQSLLVPEYDIRDAAGSMYGHSTIGSEKAAHVYSKAMKSGGTTTSGSDRDGRYLGSTLNTTLSAVSNASSDIEFARHPTTYELDMRQANDPRLHTQFSAEPDRSKRSPWSRPESGIGGKRRSNDGGGGDGRPPRSRMPSDQTDVSGPRRPPLYKCRYSSREGFLTPGAGGNNNNSKLTWNSVTTSYTTTSAAQPMTGASPTPSTWEYIVYPHRHIWPSIRGTYLLIARLPLRILVAVLTTLVLCFDVLLFIGAAETVVAIPVSCLLGAMAYPGAAQFDNTMNVARAMHTVNLVLIVVILPTVVCITVLHQIRMVQKYNWCLRLLRTGNYGFVPGGRGLVLADHVHNNPILLEFVQVLKDLLFIRRNPSLAHYYIEARQQRHLEQSRRHNNSKSNNNNTNTNTVHTKRGDHGIGTGAGSPLHATNKSKFALGTRPLPPLLNDIDEREEARMDELLAASNALNSGQVKGSVVTPEISKVHHYYRMDPRVERRVIVQGAVTSSPLSPSSSSETPFLSRKQEGGGGGRPVHVQIQIQEPAADASSSVTEEQIKLKLSEAKLRSIRVRNRWFLYLTLARNPSLRAFRRTRAEDYLYPIAQGPSLNSRGGRGGGGGAGGEDGYSRMHRSHEEEALEDIHWDRED